MKVIKYFFGCIGLVIGLMMFMIGAIFSLNTEIDKSDRIPIEATIVLINSRRNESYNMYYHDVFVGYTVDGKTYKSELDAYSSDFYEGMKIDIVYDKNDPSTVVYEEFDNKLTIVMITGSIITIISSVMIFNEVLKSYQIKWIKRNGETVKAKFIGTEFLGGNLLQKRRIVCEWTNPNDGVMYTFRSKTLYYYYLDEIISKNNIKFFEVKVLKDDPSKYLMNTDKIAYLANTYRPDNEDTYIEFGVIPDKDFNNNEININPINDNPIDTGIKILNNNNDVIKYK